MAYKLANDRGLTAVANNILMLVFHCSIKVGHKVKQHNNITVITKHVIK